MYSGTGVCAGQAHWQSTTLWKYSGLETSVFFIAPRSTRGATPKGRGDCVTSMALRLWLERRIRSKILVEHSHECYRKPSDTKGRPHSLRYIIYAAKRWPK